jgi:hypothetical protein
MNISLPPWSDIRLGITQMIGPAPQGCTVEELGGN